MFFVSCFSGDLIFDGYFARVCLAALPLHEVVEPRTAVLESFFFLGGGEGEKVGELPVAVGVHLYKVVDVVFLRERDKSSGDVDAQADGLARVVHGVVLVGEVAPPGACQPVGVKEAHVVTLQLLYAGGECLVCGIFFLEGDVDADVAVSGVEGVALGHVERRAVVLPVTVEELDDCAHGA